MKNHIKLISLNIWNGKLKNKLLNFVSKSSSKIDIFCFQESLNSSKSIISNLKNNNKIHNIHSEIQRILPDFDGYFDSAQDNDKGLSVFIRKNIKVVNIKSIFVYRWKNAMISNDRRTIGRNLFCISIRFNYENYNIINFHGLWDGFSKKDSLSKDIQIKKIINFVKKLKGKIVICGDFNLERNTKAIKLLSNMMKNPIITHNIYSTRNKYFPGGNECVDYIFGSNNINIYKFSVLKNDVSDHKALYIEIA